MARRMRNAWSAGPTFRPTCRTAPRWRVWGRICRPGRRWCHRTLRGRWPRPMRWGRAPGCRMIRPCGKCISAVGRCAASPRSRPRTPTASAPSGKPRERSAARRRKLERAVRTGLGRAGPAGRAGARHRRGLPFRPHRRRPATGRAAVARSRLRTPDRQPVGHQPDLRPAALGFPDQSPSVMAGRTIHRFPSGGASPMPWRSRESDDDL